MPSSPVMLRIRSDQLLRLQASLDPPVVQHYVEHTRAAARELGIDDAEHRQRVVDGVALGRVIGARRGYELSAVVALSALFDPLWATLPDCAEVLAVERLSLEAKLRIILTKLGQGPGEGSA